MSLCPLWPMFSGVFPFEISDSMGEFVNKGINLDLLWTTAIDANAEIAIHPKAITKQSRRHLATPDRDADRWVGSFQCIAKGSKVIHYFARFVSTITRPRRLHQVNCNHAAPSDFGPSIFSVSNPWSLSAQASLYPGGRMCSCSSWNTTP